MLEYNQLKGAFDIWNFPSHESKFHSFEDPPTSSDYFRGSILDEERRAAYFYRSSTEGPYFLLIEDQAKQKEGLKNRFLLKMSEQGGKALLDWSSEDIRDWYYSCLDWNLARTLINLEIGPETKDAYDNKKNGVLKIDAMTLCSICSLSDVFLCFSGSNNIVGGSHDYGILKLEQCKAFLCGILELKSIFSLSKFVTQKPFNFQKDALVDSNGVLSEQATVLSSMKCNRQNELYPSVIAGFSSSPSLTSPLYPLQNTSMISTFITSEQYAELQKFLKNFRVLNLSNVSSMEKKRTFEISGSLSLDDLFYTLTDSLHIKIQSDNSRFIAGQQRGFVDFTKDEISTLKMMAFHVLAKLCCHRQQQISVLRHFGETNTRTTFVPGSTSLTTSRYFCEACIRKLHGIFNQYDQETTFIQQCNVNSSQSSIDNVAVDANIVNSNISMQEALRLRLNGAHLEDLSLITNSCSTHVFIWTKASTTFNHMASKLKPFFKHIQLDPTTGTFKIRKTM